MGMPPNVIRHSNKYVHCPPQKPYFKVATDASFSAAVQVSSLLCKNTCLNRLGGVAAALGREERITGGGGTENWGPTAHPKVYKSTPLKLGPLRYVTMNHNKQAPE